MVFVVRGVGGLFVGIVGGWLSDGSLLWGWGVVCHPYELSRQRGGVWPFLGK